MLVQVITARRPVPGDVPPAALVNTFTDIAPILSEDCAISARSW